jgi:hypothetical protein
MTVTSCTREEQNSYNGSQPQPMSGLSRLFTGAGWIIAPSAPSGPHHDLEWVAPWPA